MARRKDFKELKKGIPQIIGEGETEYYYFKHLKALKKYKYNIDVNYFDNNCIIKLEETIKLIKKSGLTIYCVFDADVAKRNPKEKEALENLKETFKTEIEEETIILYENMPSIEYWFLLHYEDTRNKWSKSEQAEKVLKKHIKNYKKNVKLFLEKEKWVNDMTFHKDGGLEEAKKRAKRHTDTNYTYTQIYKAIEKLEE